MNIHSLRSLGIALSLFSALSFSQAAQGATFTEVETEVDWQIHNDSFNDSIAGNDVGGTKYEIYSSAVQVVDNFLIFGVRSNFTMNGATSQFAHDGLVRFSDIILNCVDNLLGKATQYAIHFDGGNESSASELGIYENTTLKSVAEINGNQTGSFGGYNSYVAENGGNPTVGTLSNAYFDGSTHVDNVMTSGSWIGEAFALTAAQQANLGLNNVFAGLAGTTTAIAADISKLQETGALCSFYLGQECNNDLTGGDIDIEQVKVPEPAAVLAIAVFGLALPATKRWRSAA